MVEWWHSQTPIVRYLHFYLDLLLSIGRVGQLRTSIYDKRDDINFHITNFPFLSSNIPSSPAYGVFISQLIRYARACSSYECFILSAMRLFNKLLGQGYVMERLQSSLRKFYGRCGDLTKQYKVPLSWMLHDILDDDHTQWHPPLIGYYTNFWPLLIWTLLPNLTFYLIVQGFHRTYATGAACQQRTLTPPDTWSCPTLGLACVLMSRPISLELVLSPDFWISNIPRYFSFASQLVRFARCCASVLDFHSKNLQITSKLLTQGYRYHKLRKTFGKFFRSYYELLSKFGDITFQEYVSKEISHPVFYGDLG